MPEKFIEWQKGVEPFLFSMHFKSDEFECPCKRPECLTQRISHRLVWKLEIVRRMFKQPIFINSGYRCQAHQDFLSGFNSKVAKGISQHTLGTAADIRCDKFLTHRDALYSLCDELFNGLGRDIKFLHVDVREVKTRWVY